MPKIADPDPQTTRTQSWLARLSFVLAGLAVVILVAFAGLKSVAILGIGLAAAAASMAAAFGFLSQRGAWRWMSLAVLVVAPIGIDGEAVLMLTPVECAISPAALRVRVPRNRPGVPRPKSPMNWARLRRLAAPHIRRRLAATTPPADVEAIGPHG